MSGSFPPHHRPTKSPSSFIPFLRGGVWRKFSVGKPLLGRVLGLTLYHHVFCNLGRPKSPSIQLVSRIFTGDGDSGLVGLCSGSIDHSGVPPATVVVSFVPMVLIVLPVDWCDV
ncbi:hypothetical protein A2U01_0049413 [Trifolium medium]|uniref:Uncharacterized protein n=1 Tax=Trifolium medium TaxID=97028 RepID=A0A392QV22_9FABA|nr:hypothetical protein [Trifolium medium]